MRVRVLAVILFNDALIRDVRASSGSVGYDTYYMIV